MFVRNRFNHYGFYGPYLREHRHRQGGCCGCLMWAVALFVLIALATRL